MAADLFPVVDLTSTEIELLNALTSDESNKPQIRIAGPIVMSFTNRVLRNLGHDIPILTLNTDWFLQTSDLDYCVGLCRFLGYVEFVYSPLRLADRAASSSERPPRCFTKPGETFHIYIFDTYPFASYHMFMDGRLLRLPKDHSWYVDMFRTKTITINLKRLNFKSDGPEMVQFKHRFLENYRRARWTVSGACRVGKEFPLGRINETMHIHPDPTCRCHLEPCPSFRTIFKLLRAKATKSRHHFNVLTEFITDVDMAKYVVCEQTPFDVLNELQTTLNATESVKTVALTLSAIDPVLRFVEHLRALPDMAIYDLGG